MLHHPYYLRNTGIIIIFIDNIIINIIDFQPLVYLILRSHHCWIHMTSGP